MIFLCWLIYAVYQNKMRKERQKMKKTIAKQDINCYNKCMKTFTIIHLKGMN